MPFPHHKARLQETIHQLIARGSKTLHVDLYYILHGLSWLGLTQISSALLGFVMSIGYANLLTPEVYGTYRYIISTYGLIAIIALPGIDTAIIQSLGKGFESSYERGLHLKFRWSLAASLACIGVGIYHAIRHNLPMAMLFWIAAIFLPFMETGSLSPAYFNAKKDYRHWTLFDIVSQIVTTMIALGSMFFFKRVDALLIAYFIGNVSMRWLILLFIHRQRRSLPKDETPDQGLIHYARSLSIFQVTSRLIGSIDSIVLFHFLGPAQLAVYSIAMAIPGRFQGVFRILGTLAMPKFANRNAHEIAMVLPKKMLLMASGVLVICIGYASLAPWFFQTFFPKYLSSVPYSQLFVFSLISSITHPVGSFLLSHKRIKENYFLSWSSLGVKILCLVTLVPMFGIWGAIISNIGSAFTTTILCFVLLWREQRIPTAQNA